LIKQKQEGIKRKLVMLTLDDPDIMLYGSESLYRDGIWMDNLRSSAFGFKVGSAVGMGYLKHEQPITEEWILNGTYELEVQGKMIAAKVHIRSPYDPKNKRTKM
jgi:4-methylaminobutanoate oxidase (formaldehyde-forming)